MTEQQSANLRVGDTIYWARVIKSCDISETMELAVCEVGSLYTRAVHRKSGQTFLFEPSSLQKYCYISKEESEEITGKRRRKKKVKTDDEMLNDMIYGDDEDESEENPEDDD